MTGDLVTWLREQIAADQHAAQAAMESQRHAGDPDGTDTWRFSDSGGVYTTDYGVGVLFGPYEYTDPRLAAHVVAWQPKRVLAQCKAHTAILDRVEAALRQPDSAWDVGNAVLHALALAYQHRPGYDARWRP